MAGRSEWNDPEGELLSEALRKRDAALIQIVDAALSDAAQRSGAWLACRPGCTQCCHGVFAISQLDALRLRTGLEQIDPARAARVRERARESLTRLAGTFPGDRETGILDESEGPQAAFEEFGNEEPCPALDPATGLCDLYEWRPMTCRVFGPPVRVQGGFSVCELCFQGASAEEVAACEMVPDPDDLEEKLIEEVEATSGARGQTIVPFCLANRATND